MRVHSIAKTSDNGPEGPYSMESRLIIEIAAHEFLPQSQSYRWPIHLPSNHHPWTATTVSVCEATFRDNDVFCGLRPHSCRGCSHNCTWHRPPLTLCTQLLRYLAISSCSAGHFHCLWVLDRTKNKRDVVRSEALSGFPFWPIEVFDRIVLAFGSKSISTTKKVLLLHLPRPQKLHDM